MFSVIALIISSHLAFGTAKQAFHEIRPLIFQIKTASSSNLGKSSYGTGFVVDKKGLLITNYHVVADSIWHEKNNKVFIEIDGEALPLEIRAVDFVHDLAVVSVKHQFNSQIQLAESMPTQGEDIYSLGLPADVDWTVISGVYNGIVVRGPFQSIHMSTPLNPGMSGGPTVNSGSQLVAVNVSGLRDMQQISFGIPVQYVRNILAQAKDNAMSTDDLLQGLKAQLIELQAKMTEQILQAFKSPKIADKMRLPNFGKTIRCWSRSGDDQKDPRFIGKGESCSLEHSVSLQGGQYSGTFEATFIMMTNQSLSWLSWFNLIGLGWNPTYEVVPSFDKESKINYNQHHCYRERVKNDKGEIRTVNLCLQQMNPLSALYDAYLQVYDPVSTKSFAGASLTLAGFTLENIKRVITTTVNHEFSGDVP